MLTCTETLRGVCAGCQESLGVTPGTDRPYTGAWVLLWDTERRQWYHAPCEPRVRVARRTRPAPRRS